MVQTDFHDTLPGLLEQVAGVLVDECLHHLHGFVAMVKGEEPFLGREGVDRRVISCWGLIEREGLGEVETGDQVDKRAIVVRYDVVEFSVDEMEVCEKVSVKGDSADDFEDEFWGYNVHCFGRSG